MNKYQKLRVMILDLEENHPDICVSRRLYKLRLINEKLRLINEAANLASRKLAELGTSIADANEAVRRCVNSVLPYYYK